MHKAVIVALAGALVLGADTAQAQERAMARRFSVTPLLGTVRWDDASALANKEADGSGRFTQSVLTPTLGVSANYMLFQQLGVGFFFEAARPTTRGDYFPALLLQFGNDAQLRNVSQRVTVLMYGLQAAYEIPIGRLSPYVQGGVGAVTVNADPQQNDGNETFSNTLLELGGGVAYHVGRGRIMLDLRDYAYLDWDREKLNAVDPEFQNNTFPSANGNPPAAKSTVHNLRLAIGFSFVPRLGASDETEEEQE